MDTTEKNRFFESIDKIFCDYINAKVKHPSLSVSMQTQWLQYGLWLTERNYQEEIDNYFCATYEDYRRFHPIS